MGEKWPKKSGGPEVHVRRTDMGDGGRRVRGLVGVGGACFSLYLLYVIKVILKEFCIVCFSFHMANFSMLVLAVLEYLLRAISMSTWPHSF